MSAAVQERASIAREVRTAVRHSAVYGFGAVVAKVLGFLMLPLYTRYLGPGDYGILEILDVSLSLIGMFLNMGMTAALLWRHAQARTSEEKRAVASTAFVFSACTGTVMGLLVLLLYRPLSTVALGPDVPPEYLFLSLSSFVLAYIATPVRTYLRAQEASGTLVFLDTTGLFLSLALNIVFIAVLQIGLVGILLSHLIVNIGWICVMGWSVRKVGIAFDSGVLRQMVKFGLPLIFSNLALFVLNFSDRFFLQHLRGLEVVGIYAVAYKFGFMMSYLIVQPFNAMWQSRMYYIREGPHYAEVFDHIFLLYSLILTYAWLAMALFSPEIVSLMVAPRFAGTSGVIPFVALAYVFSGLGYYLQFGLFLTKKTKVVGAVNASAAVLNLGLNYVLIGYYGVYGAAWATTLSFLATAAGTYWCSQRAFPVRLRIGRAAAVISMAAGLYVIGWWAQPGGMMAGVALKLLLLAVFPVLLWQAGILSAAEIDTVRETLNVQFAGRSYLSRILSRRAVKP